MPETINDRLLSWASILDDPTRRQAEVLSRHDAVYDHVALMPDAHFGRGATIGSVVPTRGALIPSAVGVDLGCGMEAAELDLTADRLPDDLRAVLVAIERAVPAGKGQGHHEIARAADRWLAEHRPASDLTSDQVRLALSQFGSLGAGNHFVELSVDERGRVWLVLHSGSRGIGNALATGHIERARILARHLHQRLEDPELATVVEGTPEFTHYVGDMLWAQDYAAANRAAMLHAALRAVLGVLGSGRVTQTISCHHNFAVRETHAGEDLWITRKGAIRARVGDWGVIPGSMGARSYVVRGRGEPSSWTSCSHGAGRVLGRQAANRRFSADDLRATMGGITWLEDRAARLVDEIPDAYKPIEQVMADQADLVEVVHELRQLVNYKGT